MSLVLFLVVTFGAATVAFLGRGRAGVANGVGIAGLAVAVLVALTIDPAATLTIGGTVIVASDYVRLFLILGSLVGLALAVVGLAAGSSRDAPAVMLGTLGGGGLALSLPDPRIAVLAATAAGLGGVVLTLTPTGGRIGATAGMRRPPGARGRRCDGDRGDRLDRARPEPAGRATGRLRTRLPRVRGGRRDPLRGHPVPRLGRPPHRRRPGGRACRS